MEDVVLADKIREIRNKIIIVIIIIVIIIAGINIYHYYKTKKTNNNLKQDGFTEFTKNIYTKESNSDKENVSYTYISDTDEFTKSIESKDEQTIKKANLTYHKGKISGTYKYLNITGCDISYSITYHKNNYQCEITNNVGKCKQECNNVLKTIKKFKQEAEKYVKKMNS